MECVEKSLQLQHTPFDPDGGAAVDDEDDEQGNQSLISFGGAGSVVTPGDENGAN